MASRSLRAGSVQIIAAIGTFASWPPPARGCGLPQRRVLLGQCPGEPPVAEQLEYVDLARGGHQRLSCGLALDSGFAALPLPLAQLKLLDLAGGCFRKVGYEVDVIRNLVSGDLTAHMPYDLFRGRRGTRAQHHESLGSLAP